MSDQPTEHESKVKLFGQDISLRGLVALILIVTLCVVTVLHPEVYKETFTNTVIGVVGFYFAQQRKT